MKDIVRKLEEENYTEPEDMEDEYAIWQGRLI